AIGRYQFALDVAEVFGLPTENIMAVNTPELGQPAQRPLQAGMMCDRLLQTLNWNLRGVVDGLEYFKQAQKQ
ncbi:MAG TPA: SDR family NAD(P)-dependent oxidoreductase, partial [Phormidium sp.]